MLNRTRILALNVTALALVASTATGYAYAENQRAHTDGGPYVVSITGTSKGGFVKSYNTGETVVYKPLGQAQKDCAGGQYCLGLLDARYPDLTEWKRALEKAR